jgi:hypothetical protein
MAWRGGHYTTDTDVLEGDQGERGVCCSIRTKLSAPRRTRLFLVYLQSTVENFAAAQSFDEWPATSTWIVDIS